MTLSEYSDLPIEERLNLCERGIGLMTRQLSELEAYLSNTQQQQKDLFHDHTR
jgi:hypothetical protein